MLSITSIFHTTIMGSSFHAHNYCYFLLDILFCWRPNLKDWNVLHYITSKGSTQCWILNVISLRWIEPSLHESPDTATMSPKKVLWSLCAAVFVTRDLMNTTGNNLPCEFSCIHCSQQEKLYEQTFLLSNSSTLFNNFDFDGYHWGFIVWCWGI